MNLNRIIDAIAPLTLVSKAKSATMLNDIHGSEHKNHNDSSLLVLVHQRFFQNKKGEHEEGPVLVDVSSDQQARM